MASAAAGVGWLTLLFWVVVFALVCALLFVAIFSLFTLTDLNEDNLNPNDACKKLNSGASHLS
jgi:hypothetical protein